MSPRLRRAVRRTIITGLTLAVVAAAAGLWLARAQKAHDWVAAQVAAALGPSLQFADAHVTLWPPLSFTLEDLAWLDAGGDPAATAARVHARISLRGLLRGHVVISSVGIDRPAATLARDPDGALRVGGRALTSPTGAPAAAAASADWDALLPSLRIRDGSLLLIDRTGDPVRRIALSDIRATIEPTRPGARLTLTATGVGSGAIRIAAARLGAVQIDGTLASCALPLRGDLRMQADDIQAATVAAWLPDGIKDAAVQGRVRAGADLRGTLAAGELHAFAELSDGRLDWRDVQVVAPIALRGNAAWSDRRLYNASADVEAAGVQRGAVDVRTVQTSLTWDGNVVTIAGARANAFGGTWVQSGHVALTEQPLVAGELHGDNVDGAAMSRALGSLWPELRALHADGPLTVRASGRGVFGQNLRAHVDLQQKGGSLGWAVVRATAPLSLAGDLNEQGATWSIANGEVRSAALAVDRGAIHEVNARLGLANGALRVDSLSATANGDTWQVSGSVPLQTGLPGSLRASGRAGRLDLPDIEASFTHQDGALQIPSFRARVFGANWTGGVASLSSAGMQAHVSASGVNLQALLATLADGPGAPQSPGGIATLSADLTLNGEQQRDLALDLRLTAGSFAWNDLVADAPAHFAGTLRSEPRLSIQSATASAAVARYGSLRGESAAATFAYERDTLTFSDLTFRAAGGSWKHTGTYQLEGNVPITGTIAVTQADPAAALTMLGHETAPVEGAKVDLTANWKGTAVGDWTHSLVGAGQATMRGGAVRSTAVLSAMWDALMRRARRTDVAAPRNLLQVLSADFTLSQAALHTTDLKVSTTDYTLSASGSLGLSGALDLDSKIILTSAGLQHMFSFGVVPLPTSMLPTFPPIPTRISGSVDAPDVRPDVRVLPESTLRWFVGAAVQVPRAIGGAVVKPFESLFDDARDAIDAPTATPTAGTAD